MTREWRIVSRCIFCGTTCYELFEYGTPSGEFHWGPDGGLECNHQLRDEEEKDEE